MAHSLTWGFVFATSLCHVLQAHGKWAASILPSLSVKTLSIVSAQLMKGKEWVDKHGSIRSLLDEQAETGHSCPQSLCVFFFFFSCLIYNSQVSRIRELTAEVLSNQKYHGKTHEVNTTTPDLFPY